MALQARIGEVTERLAARSRATRAAYLERIEAAVGQGPARKKLGCANFAHGFAACAPGDKAALKDGDAPNLGIVTAYNDMLSAHQPYERYPELIKRAARAVGATAQVAGGVPAMCDGVTQGEAGMDLSRCSRATSSRSRPPWRCRTRCSTPRSTSASATRSCRGC